MKCLEYGHFLPNASVPKAGWEAACNMAFAWTAARKTRIRDDCLRQIEGQREKKDGQVAQIAKCHGVGPCLYWWPVVGPPRLPLLICA